MPFYLYYYLHKIIVRLILFPTYINLLFNFKRILKLTTYIIPIAINTYSYNIPLDKLIASFTKKILFIRLKAPAALLFY